MRVRKHHGKKGANEDFSKTFPFSQNREAAVTVISKPSRLLSFQHSRKKLLSTRLILFLSGIPYLNHTCGPAFAVHPRTSAIFSQQEDKSEPAARRPQASCPSFRIYLYRIGYLQVHRPFRNFWIQKRLLYVHKFYIAIRLLYQLLPLYPDFSGSRHDALGGIPVSYRRPNRYPTGFFPYTG